MSNIDFSKINWTQGLDRLYNAIWSIAGIITIFHLLTGFHVRADDWLISVVMVGGVPFAVKKTLVWVFKGFVK